MTTFKKTIMSFGFFALVLVAPNLPQTPAKQTEPMVLDTANSTFQGGERLTYRIYYNWNFVWLAAGEVTFKVFDEGKQYHFQAYGETYDSYEWFYKAKHVHNSWADKTSLLPNYSEREIQEGDRKNFEKIKFDQESLKMTVWRAKEKGDAETKTEHTVKTQVHDILSSMYFLRTIDFSKRAKGADEPFRIFMDKEEFPLKMRYLGPESRKKVRGMGRFNTLKFEPQVIVGDVFKDSEKMTVWVSDDENRIPVLIETPVSVGSVKIVLKSYSGLKYELSAKQ
jgi:hypothetical protein